MGTPALAAAEGASRRGRDAGPPGDGPEKAAGAVEIRRVAGDRQRPRLGRRRQRDGLLAERLLRLHLRLRLHLLLKLELLETLLGLHLRLDEAVIINAGAAAPEHVQVRADRRLEA